MKTMTLMDHEYAAVLDALRRDMRSETDRASTDPAWSEFHSHNARHDRDLLEALNPKRPYGTFRERPDVSLAEAVRAVTRYVA